MPKTVKSLTPDEERTLRQYIRYGANDAAVARMDRRKDARPGEVAKILKRKHVQAALAERMAPVMAVAAEQAVLGEQVRNATAQLEEENAKLRNEVRNLTEMPMMTVEGNEALIEHELMRLVRLDPERYGRVKVVAIQTAFAYMGVMKTPGGQRVIDAPKEPEEKGPSVYESIFDRKRLEQAQGGLSMPEPAPLMPEPMMAGAVPPAKAAAAETTKTATKTIAKTTPKVKPSQPAPLVVAGITLPPMGESLTAVEAPVERPKVLRVKIG
jgi:hypothetical protein